MSVCRVIACLLLLPALVAGCAVTRVDGGHPALTDDAEAASVYFIRPWTERYMGFADNAIRVDVDREPLLVLGKGEYTLARLQPGRVFLGTRSDTTWGPDQAIRQMARERRLVLEPGETYFIVFRPFDGEFRGVHFEVDAVSRAEAAEVSRRLRAVGEARSAPIGHL